MIQWKNITNTFHCQAKAELALILLNLATIPPPTRQSLFLSSIYIK